MTNEERFEKMEKESRELKEKLEKQNRKLRRLSLASVALALAALIGGTALSVRAYTAAIEPTAITTQVITLKDTSGRVRLILSGQNGAVSAFDVNGKLRVRLDSAGTVYTFAANGKQRVTLDSDGRVFIRDSNGVTRVSLIASVNRITSFNASGVIMAKIPQ